MKPVIILAFANSKDHYLQTICRERKNIFESLQSHDDKEYIKVHKEENTSIEDIFKLFNRYPDRIVVFHYGGHAGSNHLQLENATGERQDAYAIGLAQLMGQQKQLKLVFLNGCATLNQVDMLLTSGVGAVIATSVEIGDEMATEFAEQFYNSLAGQATIQQAFETAKAFISTKYPQAKELNRYCRNALRDRIEKYPNGEIPWGLYNDEPEILEWKLPNSIPSHMPDYAGDIDKLHKLSTRNLSRLKEHTTLPFGPQPTDAVQISRDEELFVLLKAVKNGHLLITGEPGCGKSGLIYPLVEALKRDKFPVILLLAEDIFDLDWNGKVNLPGLDHALDEVLANSPGGVHGFLITDALDAVRDVETQQKLRILLRDVQIGLCGWTVVASVREFDLKHSRELRDSFPGHGVAGHDREEFNGTAHFYLTGLSEIQLDELSAGRPEIRPFIDSARKTSKSGAMHRSPFYLRLAAQLLRDGVTPVRLADWNSPAVLLKKFWEARIEENADSNGRVFALKDICRRMVDTRSMTISAKELFSDASKLKSVEELRSRGILQSPSFRYGMKVGDDKIRFTHHLLHDYAIAKTLIPTVPKSFCSFTVKEPLLPILYRQSYMFALEELWDTDERHEGFWESALKLESEPKLHGVTRILAPILAASRIESLNDLQPLLAAVRDANDKDAPPQKVLRHLASGLQDVDADAIRAGVTGWCAFAEQLANLLPASASIEIPLVYILARLNEVNVAIEPAQRLALNVAGRSLLSLHIKKEISKHWPYASNIAIGTICKTFSVAPSESEHALLSLLTSDRLAQFLHNELILLAENLKHLRSNSEVVVSQLFDAAFAAEPLPGQWEGSSSAIMPIRIQTRDQWNSIRYTLADYYESSSDENAALMTELMCITCNAVLRRTLGMCDKGISVLTTLQFRGVSCDLVEDYSRFFGLESEQDENRILSHFEKLLRKWAEAGDNDRLKAALDRFAIRNRTSLLWKVLLEAGAKYPSTLGILLENVLNESLFLTHHDYIDGGAALLSALHKVGNTAKREQLEKLIIDLPQNASRLEKEATDWDSSSIENPQNRLLDSLEEANILFENVRNLWHNWQKAKALMKNRQFEVPPTILHSDFEQGGSDLKDPANVEIIRLRDLLQPFLDIGGNKIDLKEIEYHWPVIEECECELKRFSNPRTKMAEELWGHLVLACEKIVRCIEWPKSDLRWKTVRRILLKAAFDLIPGMSDNENAQEEHQVNSDWFSPRVVASRSLPLLVYRLGCADKEIDSTLRRFGLDKSHAVRFNLARSLLNLKKPSPGLMWELVDTFIAREQKFLVVDALLPLISRLWKQEQEKVRPRLRLIADRAMKNAPDDNLIYKTLASIHLFYFIQTGDPECEVFITSLIEECDSRRASEALKKQLHICRSDGWLTNGGGLEPNSQADAVRGRTWHFFSKLLAVAQAKLHQHREALNKIYEHSQPDEETLKPLRKNFNCSALLVDNVAMQIYFASGAWDEERNKDNERLTEFQLRRFWKESAPLFTALAAEPEPHTAYHLVKTLYHLLPYAPREVFLLVSKSILTSARMANFHYETLAVKEVVKLIQRALADHRFIFQSDSIRESECLTALLQVLDLFVEAGWPEARQLTHRLEDIYR